MSTDTIQAGSMSSPHLQFADYQEKARSLQQTNVDVYAIDRVLKKRVRKFQALDSGATRCKIAAICLFVIPVLGWIATYTLRSKAQAYEGKKSEMMNDLIDEIKKDTRRKFVISVNGRPFNEPIDLKQALDRQGLSDLQKYKILQLSNQGIYNTLLHAMMFPLINWGYQNAPVYQEKDDQDSRCEYFPKDITIEEGKSINIWISGWRKTPQISTRMRHGLGIYDKTAPASHQQRIIFELDTSFTINAKTGKMNIDPCLDKINPLTGPITLCSSNTHSEDDEIASKTTENSEIIAESSDNELTTICPPSPPL